MTFAIAQHLEIHHYTSLHIERLVAMAKLLLLLAAIWAVFTVGEFAGILRKQFLQEPLYVKGEADPGKPLFLTPYIKKKDYRTGILCYCNIKTSVIYPAQRSNFTEMLIAGASCLCH